MKLTPFDLIIRYDMTVEDLVKAGNYHRIGGGINSRNFQVKLKAAVTTKVLVVDLEESYTFSEAGSKIVEGGFMSLGLWAIMSFGVQYPDAWALYPIIALGALANIPLGGDLVVPILWGSVGDRGLGLTHFSSIASTAYRYLIVEK